MWKAVKNVLLLMGSLCATPSLAQTNQCPSSYFTLLLSAPHHERYLISFKVKYQDQERTACARIGEFKDFFASQSLPKGMETWYLYKNSAIPSQVPFDSLQFDWAKQDAKLEQLAKKGEKYFIANYFSKYGCLQYEKGVNDADIMQYLQRWCIVAYQDDESGCLVVNSKVVPVK